VAEVEMVPAADGDAGLDGTEDFDGCVRPKPLQTEASAAAMSANRPAPRYTLSGKPAPAEARAAFGFAALFFGMLRGSFHTYETVPAVNAFVGWFVLRRPSVCFWTLIDLHREACRKS